MLKTMETGFAKFFRKITEYLSYLFVFSLPWQAKFIIRASETNYSEISLYSSYGLLVLILGIFLFWRFKEGGSDDEFRPLIYSLASLGLFIFISIFFAPDKLLAFYRYFIFLAGLSLFFVVRLGARSRSYCEPWFDKIKLIYSFLISIFFQALLGIYQFLTQSSLEFKYLGLANHNPSILGTSVIETEAGRWLRAYGGLDHPNILGGVLALALILAAYLLAKKKNLNTRRQLWSSIFLFVFYFVSLYALFFTFSRSAWLAFIVGLVALLVVFIIKKDKWIISRFIAIIFFSAVLIGVAAVPYQDLLLVRLDGESRLEQKSITERTLYTWQAKDLIEKNFLSGVGVGNYTTALAVQDGYSQPTWNYQPVHNAWLLLWAESGVFSLLSLLIFFFSLIRSGRREAYAFAILAPIIVLMIFDHWLISLPFGVIFFFLFLALI